METVVLTPEEVAETRRNYEYDEVDAASVLPLCDSHELLLKRVDALQEALLEAANYLTEHDAPMDLQGAVYYALGPQQALLGEDAK